MARTRPPLKLFVAPDGDDRWRGRSSRRKAGTKEGPFATVARARDAVRELRQAEGGLRRPVVVAIRGGVYRLDEPLVLTPQDSGTRYCSITYKAHGRERPLLSGGVRITGWKAATVRGLKAWVADLPEVKAGKWHFRQLFVNGQRRPRTRLPKHGLYHFAGLIGVTKRTPWNKGQVKMRFADGHLASRWHNLGDVEVIAHHLWTASRLPIKRVDERKRVVEFAKRSVFRLSEDFKLAPGRYYVENVFEALDAPGQWYLDRRAGRLTYLPLAGESIRETEVVAPKLSQLIRFEGDPDGERVRHVHLEGLTLAHTEWELPPDRAGGPQAAVMVPGAVCLVGAEQCSIRRCTVEHVGTYAVELERGCERNRVVACTLRDLGAGGVKLGHGSARSTVTDNEIACGGRLFPSAVGVWVGKSSHNVVSHNHIHDLYYTGISVGWSWGYAPSSAHHNAIEFNHIHHLGHGVLSDMGGIYTLGVSPGTRLRCNLIHDVQSYSYGGWGLYTDEGSSGILLENNICCRCKTGGFHQHYGRENVIRNNVFAFAEIGQLQRTREEDHLSFTFERNIVYWTQGPLLHGSWKNGRWRFDHNLYWHSGEETVHFMGLSFGEWQAKGHDRHSLIADPLFVAPERGDFRLRPGSPAPLLGFQPIATARIGPRRPR